MILALILGSSAATTVTLIYKPVDPLDPLPTYSLPSGWSLIGYTTLALIPTQPVSVYLNGLAGKWTALYRYEPDVGHVVAKPGYGFENVELFHGYSIYLTEPGVLVP